MSWTTSACTSGGVGGSDGRRRRGARRPSSARPSRSSSAARATSPPRASCSIARPALRPRRGVDAEHDGAPFSSTLPSTDGSVLQGDVTGAPSLPLGAGTGGRAASARASSRRSGSPGRPASRPGAGHLLRRRARREGEAHLMEDDLVALAVDEGGVMKVQARGSTSKSQAVVNKGAARRRSSSGPGSSARRARACPWRSLPTRAARGGQAPGGQDQHIRSFLGEGEQAAGHDQLAVVSATIRAPIRSQGLRVWVAVRSLTGTGSPPRIRSRARKDCPGMSR